MIVGHMLMQWLYAQRGDIAAAKKATPRRRIRAEVRSL
jgi:hypothetical protein